MAYSKVSELECNSVGNRASLMGSTSQDLSSKIMEFKGLWFSHSIMTGENLSLDYIIPATILSFQSPNSFY